MKRWAVEKTINDLHRAEYRLKSDDARSKFVVASLASIRKLLEVILNEDKD